MVSPGTYPENIYYDGGQFFWQALIPTIGRGWKHDYQHSHFDFNEDGFCSGFSVIGEEMGLYGNSMPVIENITGCSTFLRSDASYIL
jgi:hypothetical protein